MSNAGTATKHLSRISAALLFFFILLKAQALAYSIKVESVDDDTKCLSCHSSKNAYLNRFPRGMRDRLAIKEEDMPSSVHRKKSCVDCHSGMNVLPHPKPAPKVTCSECHYRQEKLGTPSQEKVRHYGESIHFKARRAGNEKAPTCATCHGVHNVDSPKAPESRLNRTNLPKLCGSCHKEVYSVYLGSVHGKSWQKGNTDSALCSDCHGEHAVLEHTQAKAPAGAKNIPATCSRCHASEKLAGRYPLSARKYVSYMDSFHGVALAYGDVTVANCASCHGYHEILPSSNLASMTHKSNIVKTCGRCHPGAGENFAKGAIHMEGSPTSDPIVFYVRMFYTLIIGAMTFGFVTMIGLDLYRRYHVVSPKSLGLLLFRMLGLGRRREESAAKSEGSVRTFERLTLNERLQHGTLIVSFMLLVVTGLPLFFYHFKLFHALIPGETLFQLRGAMHRVAAVILIVLSVWHALYILFTHRGHREFLEFLPRWRDITDFIDLVKYSIGKVPSPPRFGKYNIYHKFEYWAVVWGTTVMIATGFLLWFEVESAIFFPKWLLDIARVVHGYEATLAFLAIIIWHFYNVHFNPEVFPLSQLWITGKLTEEEMKMYHPLEYEEIIEEEHLRALEKERLAAASNPLPDKEKT